MELVNQFYRCLVVFIVIYGSAVVAIFWYFRIA